MTEEELDALDGEKTIQLRKAITFGDQAWSELHLKEPTAGQIAEFSKKHGVESNIYAVALIAGVPETAIKQLGARDFNKAVDFVLSFLGGAPTTGAAD